MVMMVMNNAARGPVVAAAPWLCEWSSLSSLSSWPPAAQLSSLLQVRDCMTESWRPSASEYAAKAEETRLRELASSGRVGERRVEAAVDRAGRLEERRVRRARGDGGRVFPDGALQKT